MEISEYKPQLVTESYYGQCKKLWYYRPCVQNRETWRHGIQYTTVTQSRLKTVCCSGYIQSGNQCLPVCSPSCINGDCTNPNECTCNEGYKSTISEAHK